MLKIIFLFTLILISSSSFSQKYGYIDSEYILSKMTDYREAKNRLDKLAERWTKEIEEKTKTLNDRKDQFTKEEVLLPAEEKEKRQEELLKLESDLMALQQTRFGVSGDYFQKRQELIKPIQDKVYNALQKVASKKNYTFIFDKSNQSNLIYADRKYDLSKDVLKEIGLND